MDNRNRFGDNYDPKELVRVVRKHFGNRVMFNDADPPEDWKAGLDATLKDHPSLGVFKAENLIPVPSDLVKSYVSQQALVGKDKIPLPGEKATEEDWNIVFDRLGRPKTAEEYKFADIQAPEGFPDIAEKVKVFKTIAHKLGILPKQAEGLFSWFVGANIQEYTDYMTGREQEIKVAETTLRKEWGKAYEQNIALAKKVLSAYGDKEIAALLDEGLGNDPRILRIFAKIGSKMGEDGIIGKGGTFMKTPEEAKAEIAKIMGEAQSDPKHPYVNKGHPEHAIMVQKMADLSALAYPEKQTE